MIVKKSKAENFEHYYMVGDCHTLAIALNRELKLPMISFFKRELLPEEEWYGEEERDKYNFEHAHAAVLLNKDTIIDVRGIVKLDQEEFDNMCFSNTESEIESEIFNCEEELASYYADYDEDLIQEAIVFIEKAGLKQLYNEHINNIKRNKKRKI